MIKVLNLLKLLIFLILTGILILINIGIHTGPNLDKQPELNMDIIYQLNFLENKIKHEALANKMQLLFPEGYFFTNALYGLSWCELAINIKNDTALFNRALTEARYAYQKIDSEQGWKIFPADLNPQYGIFYRGWKNYLLAKIIACQTTKDSAELAIYKAECEQIASAFNQSETPFLESYTNASWPADAFVAMASLKIHDEMCPVKYDTLIDKWIDRVKSKLDPETHLIPHSTNAKTGETIEGARGSSISLIVRFLSEIDPEFAMEQYIIYQEKFGMSILGFPAIREYPKGKSGKGDVDSGPVIFGIGFSATIVGIGTLKCLGDYQTANLLSNTIETFGFPITSKDKKKYLFEKLPIADAFICWSRISNTNNSIYKFKEKDTTPFGSVFRIHLYSFIILVVITTIFYGSWILKKIRTK